MKKQWLLQNRRDCDLLSFLKSIKNIYAEYFLLPEELRPSQLTGIGIEELEKLIKLYMQARKDIALFPQGFNYESKLRLGFHEGSLTIINEDDQELGYFGGFEFVEKCSNCQKKDYRHRLKNGDNKNLCSSCDTLSGIS